jgi:hypothetical protein
LELKFHPNGIEVYITGYLLKIVLRIHQERFVTPLVKMAPQAMFPVVIGSIGDIEMTHEFLEVS